MLMKTHEIVVFT